MSGHSKWATIKHQKAATDAKRGQLFTKLTREIIVAVRQGGGSDPDANSRLRLAVQKARDSRMPSDNIERAVRKGSGTFEEGALTEAILEGYGPGGTAIMVRALTDNRNRTVQEVRNIFNRHGGSLGESGCVAWLFEPKGMITTKGGDVNGEELALEAIDAGAEDVKVQDGHVEIYTPPETFEAVRAALERKNVPIASAELSMMSKTTVELDEKAALQTLKLLDKLENLDEVQHVASNADFPDSVLEKYQAQIA